MTRRQHLVLVPQLTDWLGKLGAKKSDSSQTASGLKEALSIGLVNAVTSASQPNGYFANELIKILLPEKLRSAEKALQMVGMSKLTDEVVLGMNRAAEKAAPAAKSIFLAALKSMTISDAMQLFKGGDTAATQYFQKTTTPQLTQSFQPLIAESLETVGAVKSYDAFVGRFKQIPFLKAEAIDLPNYTTGKAIEGLFYLTGQEEKKIRTNPAAQVTPLLREIFGKK